MRKCKFKVGEKVRIKTLDEIRQWEKENKKKIPCGWVFPMNEFCNDRVEISRVEWDSSNKTYRISFNGSTGWAWSEEMFEKIGDEKMTNQELETKIAELKAEFDKKIAELIAKAEKQDTKTPKGEIWRPKHSEQYWFIRDDGSVTREKFCKDFSFDKDRLRDGNYYRTKEEAEFEAQCEKYTRLYRKYVEEHSEPLDWSDENQDKWFAYYEFEFNKISYGWADTGKDMAVYANSQQIIKDAIDFIGGEEVAKKYLFRVKENDNV